MLYGQAVAVPSEAPVDIVTSRVSMSCDDVLSVPIGEVVSLIILYVSEPEYDTP